MIFLLYLSDCILVLSTSIGLFIIHEKDPHNPPAINGIFDAELVAITMCGITKHKKNYEEIKKKLISTGQYSSILQCITNIELVIRNIEELVTTFIALTVLEGLKKN